MYDLTNSPHQIRSPWTNGPPKLGPPGQMVHNQFGPHISASPQSVTLDKLNIQVTICLGGPYVHGDQILGDHSPMGTELVGDRLSKGTNQLGTKCGGPNVQGPYGFGTKCVTASKLTLL